MKSLFGLLVLAGLAAGAEELSIRKFNQINGDCLATSGVAGAFLVKFFPKTPLQSLSLKSRGNSQWLVESYEGIAWFRYYSDDQLTVTAYLGDSDQHVTLASTSAIPRLRAKSTIPVYDHFGNLDEAQSQYADLYIHASNAADRVDFVNKRTGVPTQFAIGTAKLKSCLTAALND